jgi:hypothetical protein
MKQETIISISMIWMEDISLLRNNLHNKVLLWGNTLFIFKVINSHYEENYSWSVMLSMMFVGVNAQSLKSPDGKFEMDFQLKAGSSLLQS